MRSQNDPASSNQVDESAAPSVTPGSRRIDPFIFLTLLLCIFAVGPLLQPGYFWGAHDAKNSLYFLFEFDQSIADGILWPRWGPDWGFGYGYPFWNIYGPLAYFAGEALHLIGFDLIPSVKLVFALSILGSALTMYLFVRRLMGRQAGLLAGLVYAYVPYHLFDVYVRAALAESFSFIFIPLVFWAFYELVDRPRLGAVIGAGFAYAAVMLSSNVLLLMITPPLALMVAVMLLLKMTDQPGSKKLTSRLWSLFLSAIPPLLGFALALGLLAIFLLPAVLERGYVRLDQWFGGRYTFGEDFVHIFQLFSPRWGFGASIAGPDDETGFQLGLVPLILFILSIPTVSRLVDVSVRRFLRIWQVITIGTAFLMTPASRFLWDSFPLLQSVQFPWRLGVLTATGLAITAGTIVGRPQRARGEASATQTANSNPPSKIGFPLIILVALVILGSYPYLKAEIREPNPNEGPVSLAALFRYQQASDEMTGTTAWARRIPGWSVLAEQVVQGGSIDTRVNYTAIPQDQELGIHSVDIDTVHELVWVYAADDQQTVTFMIPYYPGWTAYVYQDLQEPQDDLKARVGPLLDTPQLQTSYYEGWIVVPVPAGEHFVELRFEETPIRTAGKIISLTSLLIAAAAVGGHYLLQRRRQRHQS